MKTRTKPALTAHPFTRQWAPLGVMMLALVGALAGCGAAGAGGANSNSAWPYLATYSACDPGVGAKLPVTTVVAPAPAAAATSVFVTVNGMGDYHHDGALYALNAGNGALRWCVAFDHAPVAPPTGARSYPASATAAPGNPTAANGSVYVSVIDGGVFAFDATNGALRWQRQLHDLDLSQPSYADGTLYVGSLAGIVYALDAQTGAVRWQRQTPAHDYIGSPIVVAGNLAYVSSYGSALYALDTATGAIRWTFPTLGRVYQPPVIADGLAYIGVGEGDGHVYAVDALTGKLRWSYATGNVINNAPTLTNGVVYVCNEANPPSLMALDAATGALRWRYLLTGIGAGSAPLYAQGVIYLIDQGVLALDARSQRPLWCTPLGDTQSQIDSAPILWQGALYLTREDGMTPTNNQLITLNPRTGALRWSAALIGAPLGLALG